MSKRAAEREDEDAPHPRETTALFGHAEAEQQFLLNAYRSGACRMPG